MQRATSLKITCYLANISRKYMHILVCIILIMVSNCFSPSLLDLVRESNYTGIETQIGAGSDINQRDESGRTALMIALEKEDIRAVRMLLDAGADPNLEDNKGKDTIEYASSFETRSLLVQSGASIAYLHSYEIYGSSPEQVEFYLANGLDINFEDIYKKRSLLHEAAERGDYEIAEFLIEKGADVNCRDKNKRTPLMYCAGSERYEFYLTNYKLRQKGKPENTIGEESVRKRHDWLRVAGLLIENGCDVDAIDHSIGTTALSFAVEAAHAEMVRLLLESGARLHYRTPDCYCQSIWYAKHYIEEIGIDNCLKERLDILRILEDYFWSENGGSLSGFDCYAHLFPSGKYLTDEALWLAADKNPTVQGYELYLRKYPKGAHTEKGKEKLDTYRKKQKADQELALLPEFQKADATGTDEAYLNFIMAHPRSDHVKAAASKLKQYRVYQGDFVLSWTMIPEAWAGSAGSGDDFYPCGVELAAFSPPPHCSLLHSTGAIIGSRQYFKSGGGILIFTVWTECGRCSMIGDAVITSEGLRFGEASAVIEKL